MEMQILSRLMKLIHTYARGYKNLFESIFNKLKNSKEKKKNVINIRVFYVPFDTIISIA